jgi:hypothetical protein
MSQVRAMAARRQTPVVNWVCVTDSDGHVRMEMRWRVGRSARGGSRAASAA